MAKVPVILAALVAVAAPAGASLIRGGRPLVAASWMSVQDVTKSLLDVLEDALGSEHRRAAEVRVEILEEALRPLYKALPKNSKGLLGHSTVRYALHRLFVARHGMYVKGLDVAGGSWNTSSPTVILEDRVPSYVQHLFERRLSDGFDLHEVAVLAATLEHLIHAEDGERLRAAYRAEGLLPEKGASDEETRRALEAYMIIYYNGGDLSKMTPAAMYALRRKIDTSVPNWNEVRAFVTEAFTRNVPESMAKSGHIPLATAQKVVEDISENYGAWQNRDCKAMKSSLVKMEDSGDGRVKLSDFYAGTQDGAWQFTEDRGYLRHLGALDESNVHMPRVIIPNYINSASNCLTSSSMHSVCCIPECEALMDHLERHIGKPTSGPAQVARLVSALGSDTVPAPRELPSALVRRLEEVAEQGDGTIHLHGRLFAQWMHHAYPRECPYPHRAGTTKPQTPSEWMSFQEQGVYVAEQDMDQHIQDLRWLEKQPEAQQSGGADSMPWTSEEELLAFHQQASPRSEIMVVLRGLMVLASVFAGAVNVAKLLGTLDRGVRGVRRKRQA